MKIISRLINLPISLRKLFLIQLDILLLISSYIFTHFLIFPNLGISYLINNKLIDIFTITFIGILIYYINGQYKGVTRYLGSLD